MFPANDRRSGGTGKRAGDIMNADRTVLTDEMWAGIENMLPGRKSDPGGTVVQTHQKAAGSKGGCA